MQMIGRMTGRATVTLYSIVILYLQVGNFNHQESMTFKMFANVADCFPSFMLSQKCLLRNFRLSTKLNFLAPFISLQAI